MREAMETLPEDSASRSWPPDRFYWAELDSLGWAGTGSLPEGLLLALADELPVPVEDVHAVAISNVQGRVLVCACPRDTLGKLEGEVVELKPRAVPAGLAEPAGINTVNLLVGEFEPAPVRAARRSRQLLLSATLVACSLLTCVSLLRRAYQAALNATNAAKAADALVAQRAADRRDETLAAQAKAMLMIADSARRAKVPADATACLEAMLHAWPTQLPSRLQSVSITGDGISLAVVVDGDPAPLLKAFTAPAGYALDEPRITSAGAVTRLGLHLRPVAGGRR